MQLNIYISNLLLFIFEIISIARIFRAELNLHELELSLWMNHMNYDIYNNSRSNLLFHVSSVEAVGNSARIKLTVFNSCHMSLNKVNKKNS